MAIVYLLVGAMIVVAVGGFLHDHVVVRENKAVAILAGFIVIALALVFLKGCS